MCEIMYHQSHTCIPASGLRFVEHSRVPTVFVCLHVSEATQADVRMSVSLPFSMCFRHMGIEVLGETIAPIVPHKALNADTAVAGSTGALWGQDGGLVRGPSLSVM